MLDFLKEYYAYSNTLYGWLLYWVPVFVCHVCYTLDNINEFAVERIKRDEARAGNTSYYPSLTTGKIIGRYVCCWIPVVNLLTVLFGFGPRYLHTWYDILVKLFDTPLVPWREDDEKARSTALDIKYQKDKGKQQ